MSARPCDWCREQLSATRGRFCSRKCRQSAFRLRRRRTTTPAEATPARFAYADPPYIGRAARYYKHEATFAGEVDHRKLIASLAAADYAGWALSLAADTLELVLPIVCELEPERRRRVCAWVKPHGVPSTTYGLHNAWEPLLVVGGRALRPGKRDWLRAQPARGGGSLMGRKPLAFAAFLFDALGMLPGDELVDLFPGTGIITRAWGELSSSAPRGGASSTAIAPGDASPAPGRSLLKERSPGPLFDRGCA